MYCCRTSDFVFPCPGPSAHAYWIGYSDLLTEGTFLWHEGEPDAKPASYTRWRPGQPNDSGSKEDCAHMWLFGDDSWNDYECAKPIQGMICEVEVL